MDRKRVYKRESLKQVLCYHEINTFEMIVKKLGLSLLNQFLLRKTLKVEVAFLIEKDKKLSKNKLFLYRILN
jgi:hypothetical protein